MAGERLISVVATSRNDDHGGFTLERIATSARALASAAADSGVAVELIVVEWNPPADREPLATAVAWPGVHDDFVARVITVPHEVHQRFEADAPLPLFQMIAKNVGLRRATGAFALATNADIVVTADVLSYVRDHVRRGRLLRADRVDVRFDPTAGVVPMSIDDAHVIRVNRQAGVFDSQGHLVVPIYQGFGDFVADRARRWIKQPKLPKPRWARGLSGAWQAARLPRVYTNACGDFTLLAAEDWSALHGYPEWSVYSWHLDSLLLYAAFGRGIEIESLPRELPVLHLDQTVGSGWSPEGAEELFARLTARGVPFLNDADLRKMATALIGKGSAGSPWNTAGWGLVDEEFDEEVVARGK